MDKSAQKTQASNYKIVSTGDIMYMTAIVNTAVWYI